MLGGGYSASSVTLKEYIQTLPKDRVQLAATDIDEAAKIEQEHSARPDAVFDNADLKTKSENVATDEAQNPDSLDVTDEEQNPYSFDISDESDTKKFLKGMEVSHPQLANRLRRDVRAWDEMLAVDQKNSARMRRDGGIKFTGDDAEDFDFYRWAYGRGMTQSDTSFSGLLAAAGRGLWSMTKGAGKLAVTATKAAATDNAAAQMELAATAVDSAQSAVSEYQQLGAGIAALTIGDDPQLKMAAMYELAKFSDEEQKNHNAWRKAIGDSFAEVPVDEDSVNALSEAFDISNLLGAGAGKLVTRGLKRVGAGGAAEVLGKSRKMLGSELAANAMSKVPVLGAPYKRAILSGQVEALSTETQIAFGELAESKSRLASLQGTLAQNPSWSLRDPMVKQIAAQEALVAEKQGAFDLINGQLNARRGEVTESLNLAGRGLLNRAAAGTLDVAGALVEGTGKTLTSARRGLSELLTGEADDQIVGGVADAATGGFASKGNVITRLGQDARIAAGTMKQNGASIPYFRRLNQDADATKLTRNAAAFMDKSHIAWALDKSKDLGLAGLAGAPLSGAFGYVASGGDLNAAAESAGGGMAFGIGGGAYGQWEAYKDPNYRYQELLANRRQFRDTLSSRETNGQSQLQIFDQLDAGEQIALASYAQGSPDVNFRLINDPEYASGLYDRENNSIVINRASKTPVEDIFRHEVAHFVERHGLEAQVREMYLGDAEKGVIGQYTEIDRLGNPAFDESTSPEGEKKYTYRLNAEGQKLKAEYENKVRAFDPAFTMSNDYFASELFAEQYADRIFRGGLRRDLGRNAVDSVVDSLANVPLLKQFMGQIGLLFDQNDNVVGTGVFTGLKSNPEVNKLISRFNVDVSKGRAAKMQDAPDQHVLSEKELRDPVVATKWLQSGGSVRFGADGKPVYKKDGTPQFLTEKEAEAVQRDLANALIVEIEKYAAANIDDADMLQRREQTDINGRKSVVYTGRRIPMAVIDAIEAQKRFNPHQLAHLRAMSASVEKHGVGAMIAHFYQAASSKLGGKSYKTVGGRWRRDGIVGFQITKDGNVLTNSVSWEQLAENARKAAKTKLAREVYATSGASIEAAITADVKQYLENLIDGKSGAEGIGEDRKNFINNLLGIRMASNVMLKDNGSGVLESANPLFETTDAPKTILTNLRLDRMNRVSPLDSVEYAWGPQQYRRAKMNLRPDTVEGVMTGTQESGKPTLKTVTRDVSDNSEFVSPPSDEALRAGMQKAHGTKPGNKAEKIGAARDLVPGTPVDLRIDIPTFNATEKEGEPVYAVTVHERGIGKVLGYDSIAAVDNPTFRVREKASEAIRDGASKSPIAVVQGQFNPSREIPKDINDWTAVGFDPKDHSYFYDKTTDQPVIGGKQAISVGNTVFVKDPMYGDRSQFQYRPESPQKRTVSVREDSPQFRPETNAETEQVAAKYMKTRGVPYTPHTEYDAAPESQLKRIADYFENEAKHEPTNPEVRASYDALADETLAQYRAMERAGIKIEPFSGEGEPYKSSADMMADVRDNKHLFFFLTDKAFGEGEQQSENALTQKSGVRVNGTELLFNDLFRAVHDYFGHTARGFEFGPRGEFNAWKSHSKMFSEEAQGALAAETLAQNAWVNFGPHLRGKDGAIPKKGEEGFISPKDRPFAEQKNFIVPPEYIQFRPDNPVEVESEQMKQTTVTEPIKADPEGFIGKFITKNYGLPTIVIGKNKSSSVPIISFNKYISVEVKPNRGPLKGTTTTLADAHAPTVKQYAGLSSQTYKERNKGKAIESAVNDMKDNLLFLHDLAADVYGKEVVERMSKWYDGANVIARKFAEKYGVSVPQAAAVLAAMSPQKHWFANVSLAENIMDVMRNHQDTVFSPEVEEAARADIERSTGSEKSKVVLYEKISSISGKRLSELTDPIEKAMFVRFLSQKIHPTQSYLVTPEGGLTPEAGVTVAWSGNSATMNAISAFEDGSVLGLSRALGGGHKVRNFYGNIIDPSSPLFYTSDTHNVAASLMLPLAGTDYEVAHNFGGNPESDSGDPILPVIGTTKNGLQGTYALYFEAGRRAAAERGVLPRQMQSITWEMVRLMFTDDMKTDEFKASIKQVHAQVRSGKLTIDQARKQIVELSGGLDGIKARPPAWINQ